MLLVAAAAAALVFGWLATSPVMIWLSIGASVAAGLLLAVAYNESRSIAPRSRRR
jgi:predicted exporter